MSLSERISTTRPSGNTVLMRPSSPATLALTLRRRAMGAASGGGLDGTCNAKVDTIDKSTKRCFSFIS